MKINGQLLRPLVVIGAAGLAAWFLVALDALAQHLFGVDADRFVALTILLAGIVGGGAAGAAYVGKLSHD